MSYVYIYRIKTLSGLVVKIGHGITPPTDRMNDYAATYGLDVDTRSLRYTESSNSVKAERYIHKEMEKMGYRNIRDSNYGPQEMFQAPKGIDFDSAANTLARLAREWEDKHAHINWRASDLVGGTSRPSGDISHRLEGWPWR